nr:FAD binding domain-containing protein [Micromonospora sp. NBRC 107566]
MLPAFTIRRPESIADACDLLAEYDGDAVAYAGGTELVVAMKLGLADYPVLVDLKGVPGLAGIAVAGGALRIGATATHQQIERSSEVAAVLPALAAVERQVANPRVRTSGTIGGNLAFGEPHSDPATFLVATNGWVSCQAPGGATRTVPAADLLAEPFQTVLAPDELIVGIEVPLPPPGSALAHRRFVLAERPAAIASVADAQNRALVRGAALHPVLADRAVALLRLAPLEQYVADVPVEQVRPRRWVEAAATDPQLHQVPPIVLLLNQAQRVHRRSALAERLVHVRGAGQDQPAQPLRLLRGCLDRHDPAEVMAEQVRLLQAEFLE